MALATTTNVLYDQDFYAWIYHNIELLRQGRLSEINLETLIEELESMAKRDKRELISHLVILIAHLLKWRCQPDHRRSSWRSSIIEQRYRIAKQLKDSPSLKPSFSEAMQDAYPDAIEIAGRETFLPQSTFPSLCPFSMGQLLDKDFYPQ